MTKNNSTTSRKKNSTKWSPNTIGGKLFLLPIIFLIAVLPFIMHLYEFNTGLSQFSWGPTNDKGIDFFLYYKQLFFLITVSVLFLFIIKQFVTRKIKTKFTVTLLFLFLYALLSFISTISSKYLHWGLSGLLEQFESIFVLIGYCIIVYYIWLFVDDENQIRYILKYFIISILIMGFLGLSQIIGQDFLATEFGKKLYIPSIYWNSLDTLQFRFGANRVFLTLFNPNYVGVYVSMILPLLIGLLLTEKTKKNIILLFLSSIGMLISLVGSLSSSGIISLIITSFILLILFRKYIFINFKINIILISIFLLICIPIVALNSRSVGNSFQKLLNIKQSEFAINEIKTGETLGITYHNNVLNINYSYIDNKIVLFLSDINGTTLSYDLNSESNSYILNDERFKDISLMPIVYNNILCLQTSINNKDWIFSNQTGDNTFYYLNSYGKFDKIKTAQSVLFTGYETYASSRGYIWSRSIPLLKNYILLGSGADSFAMVFPQQDYVGLYNAGFEGQLLTKPHNMYLQTGIQTGVVSLICFILFYAFYFVKSICLYINGKFNNYYSKVGVSIFIGTLGYMISGLSNDSSLAVAPIFWVLMGLGLTINRLVETNADN
jgi:hypothetical protein